MPRRVRSHPKCAGLSPEAQAWELEQLRELGLSDVAWDHERWCPRCRAAQASPSRQRAALAAPAWRMPMSKGHDERREEPIAEPAEPQAHVADPLPPVVRRVRPRRRRSARS